MILSESVALQLTKKLNGKYYTFFFDTVLYSEILMKKLFSNGLYGIGTV